MNVIILNGASSSGKSSIAKQLQALLPDNYLHIGIDTFITMMPNKSNNLAESDKQTDGFYFKTIEQDGNKVRRIDYGEYGKVINSAYHSTVRHLADLGLKLIVDDVMDGKREQDIWSRTFADTKVVYVAVHCSTEVLTAREQQRDDRIKGSAIEQALRVHTGVLYNVSVDTTDCSSAECAQLIASYVAKYDSQKHNEKSSSN